MYSFQNSSPYLPPFNFNTNTGTNTKVLPTCYPLPSPYMNVRPATQVQEQEPGAPCANGTCIYTPGPFPACPYMDSNQPETYSSTSSKYFSSICRKYPKSILFTLALGTAIGVSVDKFIWKKEQKEEPKKKKKNKNSKKRTSSIKKKEEEIISTLKHIPSLSSPCISIKSGGSSPSSTICEKYSPLPLKDIPSPCAAPSECPSLTSHELLFRGEEQWHSIADKKTPPPSSKNTSRKNSFCEQEPNKATSPCCSESFTPLKEEEEEECFSKQETPICSPREEEEEEEKEECNSVHSSKTNTPLPSPKQKEVKCKETCSTPSFSSSPTHKKEKKSHKIKEKTFPGNDLNHNTAIHYYSAGNIRNPPLVLLHGLGSTGRSLEAIIQRFASEFFVIAPDIRGFGQSDKPSTKEEEYDFAELAKDIQQLLWSLKVTRPILMAHSWMTNIAIEYYFQYENDVNYAPSRLILISGSISKIQGSAADLLKGAIEDGNITKIASVFRDFSVNATCPCESESNFKKLKKQVYKEALTGSPFAYKAIWKNAEKVDYRDKLGLIKVPTLELGGTQDVFIPATNLFHQGFSIPKSFVQEVQGAPHFLYLTHAKILVEACYDFIESTPIKCKLVFLSKSKKKKGKKSSNKK